MTRTVADTGCTDPGNWTYAAVFYCLYRVAVLQGFSIQIPFLQAVTNEAKHWERAGDILEAVLGEPVLRRGLETGEIEHRFAVRHWNAHECNRFRFDISSSTALDSAAARLMVVVAAVEDMIQFHAHQDPRAWAVAALGPSIRKWWEA